MNRRTAIQSLLLGGAALVAGCSPAPATTTFEVTHTPEEWRRILGPAAYHVMREEGTEYPNTSPLLNEHRKGTFLCAGCDLALYSSDTKFESGTGWPSFFRVLPNAVGLTPVESMVQDYSEVHCRRCGGHLGHVFHDGPPPTGLRYCMDGVALKFKAA